ncbi:MAG: hypothetical protein O7C75_09655 [Verrucomicrobia bacterium]|nr:hypothetical protein [Verrucomicrobiota bacterium]
MRRYLVVLMLIFPMNLHAKSDSPENLLGRYLDHIDNSRWDQIHSLTYPPDIENLKQLILRIIRFENQYAESRVQQIILGEKVSNEVAAQRDSFFYLARSIEQLALALRQEGFELKGHEVLGDVKEGRDRIHLLTRVILEQGGRTIDNMQIYSFRRRDRQWYMELQPSITLLLELVEHRYEMRK